MGKVESFGQSVLILVVVGILVSSWSSFVESSTDADVAGCVCPQAVDSLNPYTCDRGGNEVYRVEVDTFELVSEDSGSIKDASGLVR